MPGRYRIKTSVGLNRTLASIGEIASGCYAPRYIPSAAIGSLPYLRVDNVREFVPNLSPRDLVYVDPTDFTPTERQRVTLLAGDVVVSRTGTLGKAFVVPPSLEGAIMSQHLTRLRPANLADGVALAAYLNSTAGKRAAYNYASGSTRPELTHEAVRQIPVDLPEVPEELEISAASIGAQFDRMVRAAEEAIRICTQLTPAIDLARLDKAYMGSIQALDDPATSWLPRYWHPVSRAAEDALQREYACIPLGEIASVRRGSGTTSADYSIEGVPFVRTSSLINYAVDFFPDHYASEETYARHEPKPTTGDVLLSMEGKVGCVALVGDRERYAVKNHIEVIRINSADTTTPGFLFAFLSSPPGQVQIARRTIVQSTISGLGSASRDLNIPIAANAAGRTYERVVSEVNELVDEHLAARAALFQTLATLKKLSS
jgi:hypothetical protein